MMGSCNFCGQMATVEAQTEAEANYKATMLCQCDKGKEWAAFMKRKEDASVKLGKMCQEEMIEGAKRVHLMDCLELIARERVRAVTTVLEDGRRIKISTNGVTFGLECTRTVRKRIEV